jgi:hypothetical protein
MRLSRRRTLAVLALAAALAGLSALLPRTGSAKPVHAETTELKFVVKVTASEHVDWHSYSQTPNLELCSGDDSSGTFTTAVLPGTKAETLLVSGNGHGRVTVDDERPGIGRLSIEREAQGWLLTTSGGCVKQALSEVGCGAHAFAGPVDVVPLADAGHSGWQTLTGDYHYAVYPAWSDDPSDALGCDSGTYALSEGDYAAVLDLLKLYRCGVAKPHGCRVTVGRSKDIPFHVSEAASETTEVYDATVHIEWSATFTAAGKTIH